MADTFTPLTDSDALSSTRAGISDGIQNVESNFSDSSAPGSPVDGMLWHDDGASALKIRESGAWRTLAPDTTSNSCGLVPASGGTFTGAVTVPAATGDGHAARTSQVESMSVFAVKTSGVWGASVDVSAWTCPADNTYSITGCYLVPNTLTSGSDASNRWEFRVKNFTTGDYLTAAAVTTQGAEFAALGSYAVTVDQNNGASDIADISAGNVIGLEVVKTGSPTTLASTLVDVQLHVSQRIR